MVPSAAQSVEQYLAELPAERRRELTALRELILRHLPAGYEEGMQHGMIGYYVPLSRYPETYNRQPLTVVGLASQKRHMALYLMAVYGDPRQRARLVEAFRRAGKKLDMGRSCLRFESLDALPLEALGELLAATGVEDFIATYEASRGAAAAPVEQGGASGGVPAKSRSRSAPARRALPTTRVGTQKRAVSAKPAARRAVGAARAVKPGVSAKPATRRASGARAAASGKPSGRPAKTGARRTKRGAP